MHEEREEPPKEWWMYDLTARSFSTKEEFTTFRLRANRRTEKALAHIDTEKVVFNVWHGLENPHAPFVEKIIYFIDGALSRGNAYQLLQQTTEALKHLFDEEGFTYCYREPLAPEELRPSGSDNTVILSVSCYFMPPKTPLPSQYILSLSKAKLSYKHKAEFRRRHISTNVYIYTPDYEPSLFKSEFHVEQLAGEKLSVTFFPDAEDEDPLADLRLSVTTVIDVEDLAPRGKGFSIFDVRDVLYQYLPQVYDYARQRLLAVITAITEKQEKGEEHD